jgi:hypothetical protein
MKNHQNISEKVNEYADRVHEIYDSYTNSTIIDNVARDGVKQGAKHILKSLKHLLSNTEAKTTDELKTEIENFVKNISK